LGEGNNVLSLDAYGRRQSLMCIRDRLNACFLIAVGYRNLFIDRFYQFVLESSLGLPVIEGRI
ncbi:hypothetical protein, partial [Proteus mirabilis]|uniref:hypothetical protein n=1 Tax=Proteus mirabilis TaxID=584 RepID=UPI001C63DA75